MTTLEIIDHLQEELEKLKQLQFDRQTDVDLHLMGAIKAHEDIISFLQKEC